MIHDQWLLDRLSALPSEKIECDVYRVVRAGADPVAPSTSGGRWAPGEANGSDIPVLYTSLERDGALAEVVSYLKNLTPIPTRPLRVAKLHVTTSRTLRFAKVSLARLGVDEISYGLRDYALTQQIGAALAFLDFDGLISPSARWECDNLTIFTSNHGLAEKIEVISDETVDWRLWAADRGLLAA